MRRHATGAVLTTLLAAMPSTGLRLALLPIVLAGSELVAQGISAGPAPAAASPAAPSRRATIPTVDHHKHLVGPTALGPDARALLPRITLPEDITAFVALREERVHDRAAIRELYTDEAVLTDSRVPAWHAGSQRIASFIVARFRAPVTFFPVAYDGDGARAHITGYVTRGRAYLAHFHWSLVRGLDGRWRIGAETISFPGPEEEKPTTAADVIRELDVAQIERGVVLSVAYWLGGNTAEQYARVRAENDWAVAEAAKHPQRLIPFCGIPVLSEHAVAEVERCGGIAGVRGIKVHFGNAGVDLRKSEHAAKVRAVFAAANRSRLAVVAHLWTTGDYEEKAAEHVRAFLDHVLPAAPDVPVQIAHMAGGGFSNDSALTVFADAFARRDPRVARVYFDVASITAMVPDQALTNDVAHMRRIGLDRFLWGSDLTSAANPVHLQWRLYRGLSPLTDEELRGLAKNVAPYLRP